MSRSVLGALRRFSARAAAGYVVVQAAVIAALLVTDAVEKKRRVHRPGFPRPGTFDATVVETATTLYTYGEDVFTEMLAAIERAQRTIFIETYLWKNDEVGRRFRDALNDAADRGVEVYVVYDWFGNLVVPRSFYRFHPNVHVLRFPPLHLALLVSPGRASGLTHRKLLIVDNEVGFVGGYNIGSLYATEWRDTHVRLTGPAIYELGHSFAQVWNRLSRKGPRLSPHNPVPWGSRIRAVNNIPSEIVYPIRGAYLDAISRARETIHLTTAYFIPDQQILAALIGAARRGVDVKVIVPEKSNHILADWLSRGFYTTLLKEGITILLYRNAMIHAKTASVDGQWAIVGTANIDRLSLAFNYESCLEVHDEDFAANVDRVFAADSDNTRSVVLDQWRQRHPLARFAELVLVPLRPFL